MRNASRRSGLALLEVLALVTLLTLVIGVGAVFMSAVRQRATRFDCHNNLRAIGTAMHNYADKHGAFPHETNESFYAMILPYTDEGKAGARPNTPIKVYLCPIRRSVSAGAKDDYAAARNDCLGGYTSILGGTLSGDTTATAVTLQVVSAYRGTSCTLLLSHKEINAAKYHGGDANDTGWVTTGYDHQRDIGPALCEDPSAAVPGIGFGTSHGRETISLHADCSVISTLLSDGAAWKRQWAWKE